MKRYWELFKKNDKKVMSNIWVLIIFCCMISSGIHMFNGDYERATFSLGLVILAKLNLNDYKTK